MHILVIYLGTRGGQAIDTFELLKSWSSRKINIYSLIISQDNWIRERYKDLPLKNLFSIKTHQRFLVDLVIQTIFIWRPLKLIRTIKAVQPDIVFFSADHFWNIFCFYFIRMTQNNTRIVYLRHNSDNLWGSSSKIINIFLEAVSRTLLKADLIITLSHSVRDAVIRKYQVSTKKVFAFPLGVHTSFYGRNSLSKSYTSFSGTNPLRLLFFGRIVEYKGLDVLIDAFGKMKEKNIPVRLTIAGEGRISSFNLEQIERLGIAFRNEWIEEDSITSLFNAHDILILPYRITSQSGPASIATAFAMPMIATNIGALKEQVIDQFNGILVEKDSSHAILVAVSQIITNPSLLQTFINNSEILRKKLSWEVIGGNIEEIFSSLYEKKNSL